MASIRTAGLAKNFGDLRAVNEIDLDLPEGGVAGFVGPNGTGKSTTIRMLLGLITPLLLLPIGVIALGVTMFGATAFGKGFGGASVVLGVGGAALLLATPGSVPGAMVGVFALIIFHFVAGWKVHRLSRHTAGITEDRGKGVRLEVESNPTKQINVVGQSEETT